MCGAGNNSILERIHLKFCKMLLHLKNSSPYNMIYGELYRHPLDICILAYDQLLVKFSTLYQEYKRNCLQSCKFWSLGNTAITWYGINTSSQFLYLFTHVLNRTVQINFARFGFDNYKILQKKKKKKKKH